MPSLAKILLPVDFSGRVAGCRPLRQGLGRPFGSQVTLPACYSTAALRVQRAGGRGVRCLNELYASRARQLKQDLEEHLSDELARHCGPARVSSWRAIRPASS